MEEDVKKRLQELGFQLDAQARRTAELERQREEEYDKRNSANEIKQALLDGDDASLLSEDELAVIESWEVETDAPGFSAMVPYRIRKAQEYDGTSWDGLAELIRKRQAQKAAARQAALAKAV